MSVFVRAPEYFYGPLFNFKYFLANHRSLKPNFKKEINMRKQLVWTLFRNDPRSVRTSGGSITYEVESNNSMVLAVVSSSTTAAAAGKRRSKNVTVVVFVVWMVVACCASSLPIASSALLRGGGGSPRALNRRRTTTDYDHETNLPSAEDEDQHDHIRRQLKKGKGRE